MQTSLAKIKYVNQSSKFIPKKIMKQFNIIALIILIIVIISCRNQKINDCSYFYHNYDTGYKNLNEIKITFANGLCYIYEDARWGCSFVHADYIKKNKIIILKNRIPAGNKPYIRFSERTIPGNNDSFIIKIMDISNDDTVPENEAKILIFTDKVESAWPNEKGEIIVVKNANIRKILVKTYFKNFSVDYNVKYPTTNFISAYFFTGSDTNCIYNSSISPLLKVKKSKLKIRWSKKKILLNKIPCQ